MKKVNSFPVSISRPPLRPKDIVDIALVCASLSDPVRISLLDLVARAGLNGICACDLVAPLHRSQPTISHHLKVLRQAGVVSVRREGTWLWYTMSPAAFHRVKNYLGSIS